MPKDSALAYGAQAVDGSVRFPSWGPNGESLADLTIKPNGTEKQKKGLWPKGGKGGVFLPVVDGKPRLPKPGETWHLVEDVKDASALHGLGLNAGGLNTCVLSQRFVRLFRGINIVLIPDRDVPSVRGMNKTAKRLYGVTRSINIAARK